MGTTCNLVEHLKAEIRKSRLTHYRLAKDAGIRPEQLDRFMAGTCGLGLESAAKIAMVLGLELKPKRRK